MKVIEEMKRLVQPIPSTAYSVFRDRVRYVYKSKIFEILVALMIYLNFITNVVEAQTNPDPSSYLYNVLDGINFGLTIFFTFELGLNVFTSNTFVSEFCPDSWNW